MFATQVLPETISNDDVPEDSILDTVGYLIVKEKKYEVKKGETKIGRDSSICSIAIEDCTVSKVHLVIESEGIDDTFIYDVGSTNQTKLGKKLLKPHCRYKLDDKSKITLGNIIAEFMLPPAPSSSSTLSNSENSNHLEELQDIFELQTQVTPPDSGSCNIPVLGKLSEHSFVFKSPAIVIPANTKESSGLSENIFSEMTQCRLDSQETTSIPVFQNSLVQKSNIFNLSTQCQLYDFQAQESVCKESDSDNDNKKSEAGDKIKSLLNDGEDDMLCVFMSLHSPKGQSHKELLKNIKTEKKDFSEVFDEQTQLQPVVQEHVHKKNLLESNEKAFQENFCNKSIIKPSITSTPLIFQKKSVQSEIPENSSNCTLFLEEEDFIKTQEFNVEGEKSVNVDKHLTDCSQDEVTQPYLGETLDNTPNSEQNDNEDLVLTQIFEGHESKKTTRTVNVVPESEDVREIEDFMATQQYSADNERFGSKISCVTRTSPELLSENSDNECNLVETLDLTQRNNQDDFIETQTFEYKSNEKKVDKKFERNLDDERNTSDNEDFIATQLVNTPLNKNHLIKNLQDSKLKISSRESSPDLVDFENTSKDFEDFVSTQLFDVSRCQISTNRKSSKNINSLISSPFKKENDGCNIALEREPEITEGSGDETESDLEIILDTTETEKTGEFCQQSIKTESEFENNILSRNVEIEENDSDSSYIFELGPENHAEDVNPGVSLKQRINSNMSDSDETDCEEIAVVALQSHLVKQEPLEKIELEETQVLTLTLPDNYQARTSDNLWTTEDLEKSPKFEMVIENNLRSSELPDTNVEKNSKSLENENDVLDGIDIPKKIKKIEVGVNNSERKTDSLLKRPLNNKDSGLVPLKKSKTKVLDSLPKNSEKKLLKLIQTHDIAQIEPRRTRSLTKMISAEEEPYKVDASATNENIYSRRKSNPKKLNDDPKAYSTTKKVGTRRVPCRERAKETSPKEKKKVEPIAVESDSTVLRRSRRSSRNSAPIILEDFLYRKIPPRRSKRISSCKNEEYFSGSCVNVVFTGFDCESLDKIISELGGKKANDVSHGEVVVADKVRRTVKFLCAIGLGLPIASPEWLLSSKREQKFLNPWNFILKDEESEKKYNFELKNSLERSQKVKLLEGFSVFATKSTKPPQKEMFAIVECCGGTPILSPPDVWPKKTIIVSCMEDKQWWPLPKFKNIKIVHYEFILGGVLRQKLDFKTYNLRFSNITIEAEENDTNDSDDGDIIQPTKENGDCIVCSDRKTPGGRRQTTFYWETCTNQPAMHVGNCFELYHTVENYKK